MEAKYGSVKFSEWIHGKTDEELRTVFFNMDLAMKYIHEKGFCIKSFDLNEIEILNNSPKQVKFNTLLKLPNEFSYDNELIHEDIYNMAFLHIGIYTKCLKYMKPKFLKENFDSFATFLPEGDVPYYRGIVQRGANVYFSDYVFKARERDINKISDQVDTNNSKDGSRTLVKSNGHSIMDYESSIVGMNSKINDSIYRQLNIKKDAAFIGFMIFPTIIFVLSIILIVILCLSKMS